MQHEVPKPGKLDPETRAFYCRSLTLLNEAKMPYLVGGAYAFERYTGIQRDTKDLDIFVRQEDCDRVLKLLESKGYTTELTFPHWLGKAYDGDSFVDVIFRSGNGVSEVNDGWFERAVEGEVLDIPVKLCAAEDILWTKIFIMERERFDGADVAHILRSRGENLDWDYLIQSVGEHWRVLLAHLTLFGFIYPGERGKIPPAVMHKLVKRLEREIDQPSTGSKLCQGTILSRAQYLVDLEQWGYTDGRLEPRGNMTPDEVERWTEAIDEDK